MPTNRRRKSRKVVSSTISENLREYFLTGQLSSDIEVFQISGNREKLKLAWQAVEKEILRAWIKANPCTRPYASWQCASERRKQIGGAGPGWTIGMAIDADGLPKYWQLHWKKRNPPIFESQAAYLERLDLLTSIEMKYFKKHQRKLLEPQKIEFTE